MLIAEMAAWYSGQGMTLIQALKGLYAKYGNHAERTLNLLMPGLDGMTRTRELMENLRNSPPTEISGVPVVVRRDYQTGIETDTETGKISEMELAGANVLRFELQDGSVIIVRPSGTEPKTKVYIMVSGETYLECEEKVDKYSLWANAL
jgi:phosphoglucomutase